ncbi:SDR family oxidoreductase [Streptomyces sp. NPDC051639]|uniref:SDR family oxidoreductase n=1 Tax=unclassified Streptomyces TaxID=2593676 RepID=UPI0034274D5B
MTDIAGQAVIVTGANGGLGRQWVAQALVRGAAKVYATDVTPGTWDDARVTPLVLDVTREETIDAVVAAASDATILINNAGIALRDPIMTVEDAKLRHVFDVNFFGTVTVTRRLAPVIVANGGGAILNVISLLSWLSLPAAYSAAKAALWSVTNAFRLELAPHGVDLVALHMGYTATPMTEALNVVKNDPADIVRAGLDGIQDGSLEVLADQWSVEVKAALAGPVQDLYPQLSGAAYPFRMVPIAAAPVQ